MTAQVIGADRSRAAPGVWVMPLAIFLSALLVFLVQPLIAKLLLPRLGGAPAVWNTSLVFFQAALLLGYAYAHALQRLRAVRAQALVHLGVLLAAAAALPLHVSGVFGPAPTGAPTWWLLGVLAVSIGAPFAALSATAPLLQAWWAARFGVERNPYALYAASNLGSLAALLGYPLVVEPALTMDHQRMAWSLGYGAFIAAAAAAGWTARSAERPSTAGANPPAAAVAWRRRAWWAFLGAVPSSLLLGVTAHISTDVASAPFLWVVPLALYLLTFVLVFQDRPVIPPRLVLVVQGVLAPVCLILTQLGGGAWLALLGLHLATFFFTALLCHGRLAADRPEPERLTEFYLALSIGGVLGGAFNALAAPALFDLVWEYPLVLIIAAAARPVGPRKVTWGYAALTASGLILAGLAFAMNRGGELGVIERCLLAAVAAAAFLLRDRAPGHVLVLAALLAASAHLATRNNYVGDHRSFFGVYRIGYNSVPDLGPVKFVINGTTLHGAQATDAAGRCAPLTYYTPSTPIGRAVAAVQQRGPVRAGVVGLGAGTLAAHVRRGDSMRFYEIDPLVADLARSEFTYLDACARGPVDVVIGDARLTVAREPAGGFDLLVIDAFSSDAVPTHLMTAEAMQVWLRALKPDGLLVLHVSNKHLSLEEPVAAALEGAGARTVAWFWSPPPSTPTFAASASRVVAASRSAETMARLAGGGAWRAADDRGVPAWTDDRTDVLGALLRKARSD